MATICAETHCEKQVATGGVYCSDHNACGFKHDGPTCGKLRGAEMRYCPHCDLIYREWLADCARRMEKARAGKEKKAKERTLLEHSPLRAFNPDFISDNRRHRA